MTHAEPPVGRLLSVNVGRARAAAWAGSLGRTAIDKTPTSAPVLVGRLGLEGDEVVNTKHHGGPDKAVYAVSRAELDHWSGVLEAELPDGQLGENLTVGGLAVDDAELGERWAVGEAVLEVRLPRVPCNVFAGWVGHCGLDARGWVRRYTEHGRPGAYLRVLGEGQVQTGDEVRVLHRPGHGVTLAHAFAALTTRPDLLPDLASVPDLHPDLRDRMVRSGQPDLPGSR
ncbi:MOSC domain-containing protein [Nocardioides bruguierae]|uniref:MOSC domain-containing protein n=1 Tax=Nocardioides bruguierae TaxID=2945102 RepID=A0A9X2D9M0_9ACTN|nr:MOSC domain-containing protein [Nocardioides bruguierae]MCM0621866.1 MOSC domain-containing protein [Nocardioides bruguierae]